MVAGHVARAFSAVTLQADSIGCASAWLEKDLHVCAEGAWMARPSNGIITIFTKTACCSGTGNLSLGGSEMQYTET